MNVGREECWKNGKLEERNGGRMEYRTQISDIRSQRSDGRDRMIIISSKLKMVWDY